MMAVLQTIDLKKYYGEGENQMWAERIFLR